MVLGEGLIMEKEGTRGKYSGGQQGRKRGGGEEREKES